MKIFAKFTGKHLCWNIFLIWDYRDSSTGGFFCEFCKIFNNTNFAEHLGTSCFWNVYIIRLLVPWKSFKVILGETFQSNVSYLSMLSLYLYRNVVYNRAKILSCCSSLENCFRGDFGWASWSWKQKLAAKGLNS